MAYAIWCQISPPFIRSKLIKKGFLPHWHLWRFDRNCRQGIYKPLSVIDGGGILGVTVSMWLQWRQMIAMASQITDVYIVCSTVGTTVDQRKHPVNYPHKKPVTWKIIPFDDVIMRFAVDLTADKSTLNRVMASCRQPAARTMSTINIIDFLVWVRLGEGRLYPEPSGLHHHWNYISIFRYQLINPKEHQ